MINKKIKKIIYSWSLFKYSLIGTLYTLISPFIFVILSNYFSRVYALIILYCFGYYLKYFLYKNWVFKYGKVNLKRFFIHLAPVFIISLIFTHYTSFINEVEYIAIALVFISGLSGYVWGKFVYKEF